MPWLLIVLGIVTTLAIVACFWLARSLAAARSRQSRTQQQLDLFSATAREHALCVMDASGRIVHWADGAERMHGYSAAEMIGRHSSNLFTEADRVANVPQKILELAARQGTHAFAATRVRKDGTELRVDGVLHALRDDSGQLTGFCEIDQDVSERLRLEQTLQAARAALTQAHKMEAIGRLSGGVAHDFNNVVQVIKNCVRVLQRRLADQPPLLQFVDMIERNADRAADLSQHLLGFARLEPLEHDVTNVHEVVEDAVQLLRRTFSESITLEHKLGGASPWTSVERIQLEAALLNLAANARDAMPGGGTLTIETGTAVHEPASERSGGSAQYVTIRVSQSSRAAPNEVAALALTQIQQIIEQAGGRVTRERHGSAASSVTLWLPRVRAPTGHPDAWRDLPLPDVIGDTTSEAPVLDVS
jgi:PAS domain S-box-containing protein